MFAFLHIVFSTVHHPDKALKKYKNAQPAYTNNLHSSDRVYFYRDSVNSDCGSGTLQDRLCVFGRAVNVPKNRDKDFIGRGVCVERCLIRKQAAEYNAEENGIDRTKAADFNAERIIAEFNESNFADSNTHTSHFNHALASQQLKAEPAKNNLQTQVKPVNITEELQPAKNVSRPDGSAGLTHRSDTLSKSLSRLRRISPKLVRSPSHEAQCNNVSSREVTTPDLSPLNQHDYYNVDGQTSKQCLHDAKSQTSATPSPKKQSMHATSSAKRPAHFRRTNSNRTDSTNSACSIESGYFSPRVHYPLESAFAFDESCDDVEARNFRDLAHLSAFNTSNLNVVEQKASDAANEQAIDVFGIRSSIIIDEESGDEGHCKVEILQVVADVENQTDVMQDCTECCGCKVDNKNVAGARISDCAVVRKFVDKCAGDAATVIKPEHIKEVENASGSSHFYANGSEASAYITESNAHEQSMLACQHLELHQYLNNDEQVLASISNCLEGTDKRGLTIKHNLGTLDFAEDAQTNHEPETIETHLHQDNYHEKQFCESEGFVNKSTSEHADQCESHSMLVNRRNADGVHLHPHHTIQANLEHLHYPASDHNNNLRLHAPISLYSLTRNHGLHSTLSGNLNNSCLSSFQAFEQPMFRSCACHQINPLVSCNHDTYGMFGGNQPRFVPHINEFLPLQSGNCHLQGTAYNSNPDELLIMQDHLLHNLMPYHDHSISPVFCLGQNNTSQQSNLTPCMQVRFSTNYLSQPHSVYNRFNSYEPINTSNKPEQSYNDGHQTNICCENVNSTNISRQNSACEDGAVRKTLDATVLANKHLNKRLSSFRMIRAIKNMFTKPDYELNPASATGYEQLALKHSVEYSQKKKTASLDRHSSTQKSTYKATSDLTPKVDRKSLDLLISRVSRVFGRKYHVASANIDDERYAEISPWPNTPLVSQALSVVKDDVIFSYLNEKKINSSSVDKTIYPVSKTNHTYQNVEEMQKNFVYYDSQASKTEKHIYQNIEEIDNRQQNGHGLKSELVTYCQQNKNYYENIDNYHPYCTIQEVQDNCAMKDAETKNIHDQCNLEESRTNHTKTETQNDYKQEVRDSSQFKERERDSRQSNLKCDSNMIDEQKNAVADHATKSTLETHAITSTLKNSQSPFELGSLGNSEPQTPTNDLLIETANDFNDSNKPNSRKESKVVTNANKEPMYCNIIPKITGLNISEKSSANNVTNNEEDQYHEHNQNERSNAVYADTLVNSKEGEGSRLQTDDKSSIVKNVHNQEYRQQLYAMIKQDQALYHDGGQTSGLHRSEHDEGTTRDIAVSDKTAIKKENEFRNTYEKPAKNHSITYAELYFKTQKHSSDNVTKTDKNDLPGAGRDDAIKCSSETSIKEKQKADCASVYVNNHFTTNEGLYDTITAQVTTTAEPNLSISDSFPSQKLSDRIVNQEEAKMNLVDGIASVITANPEDKVTYATIDVDKINALREIRNSVRTKVKFEVKEESPKTKRWWCRKY